MRATRILPPRYDPTSEEAQRDPYSIYRELRREGTLCRIGPGTWGVTHYADVAALLRDPRLGSEFPPEYHQISAGNGPASAFFERIVLYRDPPAHTRLRRLLGAAFTPAAVRQARPRITELVHQLLAGPLSGGSFDIVEELSFPLPVLVVCELMGIEGHHRDEVRERAADLGKAFATVVPDDDRQAADAAVVWLRSFLRDVLAQRRSGRAGAGRDDLLTRLLTAEVDGSRLTPDEIVDNAVFAFFAGFETTMNLLSAGAALLARHADQQRRLRTERGLMGNAIEELLRLEPPIQGVARFVREPVQLDGRSLRPGRVVVLFIGSANRDPAVFADPERLDIGRTPNPHVTFGGGAHLCMGAALARAEAEIAFGYLLDHSSWFDLAAEPDRRTRGIRAYSSVRLEFTR